MNDHVDQGSKERVVELLKQVRNAMMATKGADGHFHSRPMATSDIEYDGSLYYLTNDHSGKISDIKRDDEVLLTYADESKQIYLSLRGRGEVITDKAIIKQHWTAAARGWFPKGVDDPELALIKVQIEEAEYWDAPNGKVVVLLAYAKAMLTGQKPGNIGEHARVTVDAP